MEPILLDSGIQIFEDGTDFERTFNQWKGEAKRKGELVIADLKSDEGIVKIAWRLYMHPSIELNEPDQPTQSPSSGTSASGRTEREILLQQRLEDIRRSLKTEGFECEIRTRHSFVGRNPKIIYTLTVSCAQDFK